MQHRFFEKAVNSFPKLLEEIRLLDLDSGVRTFGDYAGREVQFVFITRSPRDGYTLMLCESEGQGSKSVPGRRLFTKEFQDAQHVGKFLHGIISKPVKAFVY